MIVELKQTGVKGREVPESVEANWLLRQESIWSGEIMPSKLVREGSKAKKGFIM